MDWIRQGSWLWSGRGSPHPAGTVRTLSSRAHPSASPCPHDLSEALYPSSKHPGKGLSDLSQNSDKPTQTDTTHLTQTQPINVPQPERSNTVTYPVYRGRVCHFLGSRR